MSDYLVIYEQSPAGWGAYCPDLPGLGAAGASRGEVERLIKEAIYLHIGVSASIVQRFPGGVPSAASTMRSVPSSAATDRLLLRRFKGRHQRATTGHDSGGIG